MIIQDSSTQRSFDIPRLLFIYTAILISLAIIFPASTHANAISISIKPSIIKETLDPSENTSIPITLENHQHQPLNINITLKPFRPLDEYGQIAYIEQDKLPQSYKNLSNNIKITHNGIALKEFELGPKQKKNLEIYINTPSLQAKSDYYFSVIFVASPPAIPLTISQGEADDNPDPANRPSHASSHIKAGIAVNVLLTIGEVSEPIVSIEKFSAPLIHQSGPVKFALKIRNIGQHVISPKGTIYIKNMFGQTIERMDLKPVNILADSTRTINDMQIASSSSYPDLHTDLYNSKEMITWPEKILAGPYQATLQLTISDKLPTYKQTLYFIAIPIYIIIAISVSILALIFILLRIRYYLKRDI